MITHTEYQAGKELANGHMSIGTVLTALFTLADSRTAQVLRETLPQAFAEYQARSLAPHGVIARDGVDVNNKTAVEKFAMNTLRLARERIATLKIAA